MKISGSNLWRTPERYILLRMTARVTLEMPDDLLSAIDRERGLVPRNAWIRDVLSANVTRQAPVKVPEPKPSKPPPQKAVQVPIARQTEEGAPKVVDTHREFLEQRGAPSLVVTSKTDHTWVGTGATCMRLGCPVPKDKAAHL